MNQHYMYFVTTENQEAGKTLVKKLSETGGPGAIIMVTKEEMEILNNMKIVPIGMRPEDSIFCSHAKKMSEPCMQCGRGVSPGGNA